jgi:thiamine transport system ATP-binding protein
VDMLAVNKAKFRQGDFTLAANLSIPTGARVAVIGPSGGGKSTFLNGISGFIAADTGQVLWQDQPMPDHPGLRPLSILFQDHNLFPHLNVTDNVAIGISPDMRLSQGQRQQVRVALDRVGLADKSTSYPRQLSGGQQGRVGLARVLLRQRPLLLLDEPFSALGPALKDEMLDVLRQILDDTGATALMVTHDPKDALAFADQAILIADGVATAPQPIQQLFDAPPPALRAYLGDRI